MLVSPVVSGALLKMELLAPGLEPPQTRIPEAVIVAAPPVMSKASVALHDASARPQGTLMLVLPCTLKAFAWVVFRDTMQSPCEALIRVRARAVIVGLLVMKRLENRSGAGCVTTTSAAP